MYRIIACIFGVWVSATGLHASAQTIYRTEFPPSGAVGIIHQGTWWYFTNAPEETGAKLIGKHNYYVDTGIKPKYLKNGVIEVRGTYACKNAPWENGRCTKNGWVKLYY